MKKAYILAGIISIMASSCAYIYVAPVLYTNNEIKKTGIASKTCPLNMCFGSADLGIAAAAKQGGITKIATVDTKIEGSFFSVKYSTIVTGE